MSLHDVHAVQSPVPHVGYLTTGIQRDVRRNGYVITNRIGEWTGQQFVSERMLIEGGGIKLKDQATYTEKPSIDWLDSRVDEIRSLGTLDKTF